MERIIRYMLTIILFYFSVSYCQMIEQRELLENPGFEEGLKGWNILLKDGAKGEWRINEEMAHSGKQSLFLSKTTPEGSINLLPLKPIPVEKGKEYRFQVFCHFRKLPLFSIIGHRVTLEIYGYDEKGNISLLARTSSRQSVPVLSKPGQWKPIVVWFTPASNIVKVEPNLVITGNPMEFFIDDCSLALFNPKQEPSLYNFEHPEPPKLKLSWEETLKFLSTQPESWAQIKRVNNKPYLLVNDIPTPPIFYRISYKRGLGYCKDFNEASLKIQIVGVPIGGINAEVWKGSGVYDFEPIDSRIKFALQGNPDGKIIVSLGLGPYDGWTKEHPEDVCLDQNGLPAMGPFGYERFYFGEKRDEKDQPVYSYYSARLRKEINETIIAVMNFLKKQPYYKSIIGFSLTGGHDGQWRTSGIFGKNLVDYSPAAISLFRDYMRRKYVTEDALRKATGLKDAKFETLMPPSAKERTKPVFFRDPSKDVYLADYSAFLSDEVAEMLNSFGKTIKENAGKPVIVHTYYCEQIKGIMRNLNAADRLRESPYIDILTSVSEYNPWRQPGGPGSIHNCIGSISLHNKIFVNELDYRTWKNSRPKIKLKFDLAYIENIDDFNAVNQRDIGIIIAKGQGAYYYDMGGGWFNDRKIMESIAKCYQIYNLLLNRPDSFRPDVAVILDERSCHWVSENADALSLISSSITSTHDALLVSGVPFDVFQMKELIKFPDLLNYKIYIFLNTYYISRQERIFIKENLKKKGKILVWVYASGFLEETGKSTDYISELTGIRIKTDETKKLNLNTRPIDSQEGISKGAPPLINSGQGQKFWIVDSMAVPFLRYVEGGEIAGALKSFQDWKSIYIAAPCGLTPEIINNISKLGNAYVCSAPGLSVWVNQNFLSIHGTVGGKYRIKLPKYYKVIKDAFSEEIIARNTDYIELEILPQKTYWFLLE